MYALQGAKKYSYPLNIFKKINYYKSLMSFFSKLLFAG